MTNANTHTHTRTINIMIRSPSNVPSLARQKSAIAASPMFSRKFDVSTPATAPQSPRMLRRQLSNKASPGL